MKIQKYSLFVLDEIFITRRSTCGSETGRSVTLDLKMPCGALKQRNSEPAFLNRDPWPLHPFSVIG